MAWCPRRYNTLATMTRRLNSIQSTPKNRWHNVENRQLDAQFFHGMGFRRRVRMFSVDPATHLAREITFAGVVQIQRCGVDTKQLEGKAIGFARFPCLKPPRTARRM